MADSGACDRASPRPLRVAQADTCIILYNIIYYTLYIYYIEQAVAALATAEERAALAAAAAAVGRAYAAGAIIDTRVSIAEIMEGPSLLSR